MYTPPQVADLSDAVAATTQNTGKTETWIVNNWTMTTKEYFILLNRRNRTSNLMKSRIIFSQRI